MKTLNMLLLVFFMEKIHCSSLETKNLAQFASMIIKVTGKSPLNWNGYGCWCGEGGRNTPVDATDSCCQVHDRCYDAAEAYGCSTKVFHVYNFNATLGSDQCTDEPGSCNHRVCMCDKCFFQNLATYDKVNKEAEIQRQCLKGFEDENKSCSEEHIEIELPDVPVG